MKFWSLLRWFAALAFLVLLVWGRWASGDARPDAAKEPSRPSVFNF